MINIGGALRPFIVGLLNQLFLPLRVSRFGAEEIRIS